MKKLIALVLCCLMAASLAACGGGTSTSGGAMDQVGAGAATTSGSTDDLPTVQWKMISTWGSGNVHFSVDQRFAELVSQFTNGKFQITNYGEGELAAADRKSVV